MADSAEDDDEGAAAPAQSDAAPSSAPAASGGAAAAPAATPTPAPSGPDFTSMVKAPGDTAALQQKLADIQRAKSASNAGIASETTQRLDADRARMEAAYKASAAMPDELQHGWDAQAKGAEHSTDPVTAFGSVGSVFAMLASSFAGLPMEAGLNAGAAAINAIHQGDDKAYQRDFDSWKANTDLALKRHEIQHQAYTDATNLMNSNINAGRTKMEMAATRFGDQKAQALLDAGMDKELFELIDSRNKAALGTQDQWDKIQLQHEKVMDLRNDPRYQSGDMGQKAAAIQDWNQRWAANGGQKLKYDAEADYIAAQKRANPNWAPSDMLQWKKDFATAAEGDAGTDTGMKSNTPEKMALNAFIEQSKAANNGQPPSAEHIAAFHRKWKEAPAGAVTTGKQKAAAIQQIVDDDAAKGITTSLADATKRYNLTAATPSGNRLDDIDKQINQFDNGKNAIDRTLAAIDKHWRVGAMGYATRGAERLGNIIGTDSTDAVQVQHDIQYLQTIAPRLMQDASSRGLKADADKINAIIAGLNFGDTTANTKRALTEVRDLWDKMQRDNMARRRGAPNAPAAATGSSGAGDTGGNGSAGGAPSKPRWQSAPIVAPAAGPRSESESDVAYG